MYVKAADLRKMGIIFSLGTTEQLLPFTLIGNEEFDLIHSAFGVNDGWWKELTIEIGTGITYNMGTWDSNTHLGIRIHSQSNGFAAPMIVEFITKREPEGEEHYDICPFHPLQQALASANGAYIDTVEGPWYEADWECNCGLIETSRHTVEIDPDTMSLDPAIEYLARLLAGELVEE